MTSELPPEAHRSCLPRGTVEEDWRLLGCHGHGAHGVVYRAQPQVAQSLEAGLDSTQPV